MSQQKSRSNDRFERNSSASESISLFIECSHQMRGQSGRGRGGRPSMPVLDRQAGPSFSAALLSSHWRAAPARQLRGGAAERKRRRRVAEEARGGYSIQDVQLLTLTSAIEGRNAGWRRAGDDGCQRSGRCGCACGTLWKQTLTAEGRSSHRFCPSVKYRVCSKVSRASKEGVSKDRLSAWRTMTWLRLAADRSICT